MWFILSFGGRAQDLCPDLGSKGLVIPVPFVGKTIFFPLYCQCTFVSLLFLSLVRGLLILLFFSKDQLFVFIDFFLLNSYFQIYSSLIVIYLLEIVGFELRASHLLGRHYTLMPYHSALFDLVSLSDKILCFLPKASDHDPPTFPYGVSGITCVCATTSSLIFIISLLFTLELICSSFS
jgi:hypothetical protein